MGTLYLVATPIGNLEDISARALRILHSSRLIAAEDTRVTRKLLNHFDINTPLTSYFEHNKLSKLETILRALSEGDVALVSDAGTPALNDPGVELVQAALEGGHNVCPVPGPSAPIAALTASGLPTHTFLYLGYLPRKASNRKELLANLSDLPYTLVFLEAPHRLRQSLSDLEAILGDRKIAIARELTKVHEQIWRGRLGQAHREVELPRGEFTLIVEGKTQTKNQGRWREEILLEAIHSGLRIGEAPSSLASRLATESGWPRRDVYQLVVRKAQQPTGQINHTK